MNRSETEERAGDSSAVLIALVDTLIPGDDEFPSASAVGAHGLLAERLRERLGVGAIMEVAEALRSASDGQFPEQSADARVETVHRFEREAPDLFATVRTALYYSYYQSPMVVAAIRELGFAYNDAPQPLGYAMKPFDPTPGKDAPLEPRGSYIPTDAVHRVAPLPAAARATEREQ